MKKKKYYTYKRIEAKTALEKLARFLLLGSFFTFLFATLLSGFPILAFIWNITVPTTSEKLAQVLAQPIETKQFEEAKKTEEIQDSEQKSELPEQNKELSTTPSIIIKKIGVETNIHEASLESYEDALKKGVWRVPNFGTPLDTEKPTILVAHRFGYLNWEHDFREKNSFFNLPKLEVGDQFEINWDQRTFVYEIYEKEESEDISHYSADVILYTCRFFNSDTRIFRYARKIN